MYDPTRVKLSMVAALQDYIEHGAPKGAFLTAVLSNSLLDAAIRADDENFETLAHVVSWCYAHVPALACGSKEKYNRWIKAHGHVRDRHGYGAYALDEVYKEIEKMEEKIEQTIRERA